MPAGVLALLGTSAMHGHPAAVHDIVKFEQSARLAHALTGVKEPKQKHRSFLRQVACPF